MYRRTLCARLRLIPGFGIIIAQPWEGDLFVSPNGDRAHLRSDCHGLRNAARAVRKPMCQYCLIDWRNHPDNARDR